MLSQEGTKKRNQSKQVLLVRCDGGGGEVLKLHLDVELQRLQTTQVKC